MKNISSIIYLSASLFANQSLLSQEKFNPVPRDTVWAKQFQPTSGPGNDVLGDGHGGWRSGTDGVKYKGNYPRSEYDLNFDGITKGTAVEKGLLPPIKPAIELHLRDSVITLGGDGNYYLTDLQGITFGHIQPA